MLSTMVNDELTFGRFRLQTGRQLLADGEPVALGAKPLGILSVLVAANGELVTKDRLIEQVWPGMVVEENTLQAHVSTIRKVMGEEGRWIATVPGHGYRFTGPRPGVGGPTAKSAKIDPPTPSVGIPPNRWRKSWAPFLGGVLVLAAAGGLAWWRWSPRPSNAVQIERYIVLPFANHTGDPRNDDFADALTDAVAGRIAARTWDSQVVSHNKSFAYKGQAINEAKLAEDLDLTYIVEGSLLPAASGFVVSATVVDARTGTQIATNSAQSSKGDIDTQRQSLVTGVVDQVLSNIFRHEKSQIAAGNEDNTDIRNLLIRAETSWGDPTLDNWAASMALIDKALALDPHNVHALSLAGASRIEFVIAFAFSNDAERTRVLDEAETNLLEAARIDPKRTIVHMKLGDLHAAQGRHDAARAEFERALELDPSNAYALDRLALEDIYAGEPEAAQAKLERALQLNPDDAYQIDGDTALMRFNQGQDDAALAAIRQAVTIKSGGPWAWIYLTGLLQLTGHPDEAQAALATLRQLNPHVTIAKLRLADKNTSQRYREPQERLYAALKAAGLEEGTQ